MLDNLVGKVILGWVRHFLSGATLTLVAHGYWTNDQQQQAVGAILTLLPLALSAYDKWNATQKLSQSKEGN